MNRFVIRWGKTLFFLSLIVDALVIIVLLALSVLGAFTFMEEEANPLWLGLLITLAYFIVAVSTKFIFALAIDIRDNLEIIANNSSKLLEHQEDAEELE